MYFFKKSHSNFLVAKSQPEAGSDLQNLHYFAPALKVEQDYQDFESRTQPIINYKLYKFRKSDRVRIHLAVKEDKKIT